MSIFSSFQPAPSRMADEQSYARNVGQAAVVLLATLFAAPARQAEDPVPGMRGKSGDDLSLYRQYCMANPFDALMPHLANKLRCMATRG